MWRALVVVAACGASQPPLQAPSLRVLEPGAEPRAVLRYEHVVGTTEQVEVSYKQRMRTKFENTVMEQGHSLLDLPAIIVRGPLKVTNVQSDGSATLNLFVQEAYPLDDVVDPQVKKAVMAINRKLAGTTFVVERTPSGRMSGLRGETGDALRSMGAIFPDEAIGVGAKWVVTSTFDSAGVRWQRTASYSLRDRNNDVVTIDATVDLYADEQVLNAEPNSTTRLTAGAGTATEHSVVPLRGLMATGNASASVTINLLMTRDKLRVSTATTVETISSTRVAP